MQDESAVFNTLNYQNTAKIVSMFTWPMTRAQSTWWCEIYATTAKDNSASSHLLTKVGFKEDGTINVSLPDGATRPSLLFRRYKDA